MQRFALHKDHVRDPVHILLPLHAEGIALIYRYDPRHIAGAQGDAGGVSAAAQTGRRQILSETFALCGWAVSFADLKWLAQWQFVHGVNFLCQHLEGYSLRGIRKREFERFIRAVEKLPRIVDEFDEAMWATLVSSMTVYSRERIVFQLTSGMEMEI